MLNPWSEEEEENWSASIMNKSFLEEFIFMGNTFV
jgi:hypothetical protein